MIMHHAELLLAEKGAHIGILEMRKHASWYLQGTKDASKLRRAMNEITTIDELKALLG